MTNRDIAVVVVAAGRGERLGAGKPKAFVDLVGKPLLSHAIESISALPDLAQLIIAVPESHQIEATEAAHELLTDADVQLDIVVGGETRQGSIANALAVLSSHANVVLVHDAARAMTPTSVFSRVADSVRKTGLSTVPVMKIADTIKRIEGEVVRETIDRNVLRAAQTPQGFVAGDLVAAYGEASQEFTDDAALMQAAGHEVLAVEGHDQAFKVTTPEDLAAAEMRFGGHYRSGIGTDVHRFTDDSSKPLYRRLGQAALPRNRGLAWRARARWPQRWRRRQPRNRGCNVVCSRPRRHWLKLWR